jgi:hypothetical protein
MGRALVNRNSAKNIKYLNKSFNEFKASLVDYTKTYFPTTYNDFSPTSPGMMFIEMASYVGDVLSFYLDNQVQENYLQFARQSNNLFELAYMFGYKPKVTGVAIVDVDFYQKVPSKIIGGGTYAPDFDYALYIAPNSTVSNDSNISFLINDPVDFTVSSSIDPTVVTIYELAGANPSSFLLKKTRKAISSTINTTTFSFSSPVKFSTVEINTSNLIGILDCTDSEGNIWNEVDYLGQEMIYDSIKNTNINDPNLSSYGDAPYLLKLRKTQYRFTTRLRNSNTLQIQFGAGTTNNSDEEIIPNPDNVGIGLPFEQDKLNTAYSPSNFLFTKTYGIAPSNTTLTFRYLTGGGVTANIDANTLTTLNGTVNFLNSNVPNAATANNIFNSLAVTNPTAASGGGDGDTIEEIRQNSIVNFASQQRNVTQDDYLVRALSMPAKYGNVAKAYIEPTKVRNISFGESTGVLDLYVLTYNLNKKLTQGSLALKQNLSTYLSQYRMVNDAINIKDAFIINIGINFDIIVLPNYNNNQVLTNCIINLQNYFNIENWQINQPIILRDLYILLDSIDGVQTVKNIEISNFVGSNLGYSDYAYDIPGATKNNVIYPSIDPMIFEIKYPEADIQGRIVPL